MRTFPDTNYPDRDQIIRCLTATAGVLHWSFTLPLGEFHAKEMRHPNAGQYT